ncbi:prolipoprotein diacylglyceryl transferase [Aestuariirhabdus sp. Z084]|uniref:prolipoprotein diacylglyceryl transferase n=1 Tax=Aestuariirhabdus haliotis TaxID=2918751 RepID=UPI00201B44CA|nr:prolipoprotein diacylglyceryl transferase [Aestuariirhabdus haliotis]MCL6415122.1 prolipoprotein diacylglyceryl transferase [Aestuariirhabdus haliotis]MCL6419054.1 prolipoprotein diacylglyceryl transferase [Aestuariirhabdus haliotis]
MIAYPNIDPVALSLGPLQVHWYGLMYLLGFAGGWWLGQQRAKVSGGLWQPAQIGDLLFYIAMGVIIGGRSGYVLFYNMDYFLQNPLWLFYIWEGGMSFHGGLLGVLAAMLLYGRRIDKRFFQLTDYIAPLIPIGLGTGRIGNFIGGELWGREGDVPWAMIFPGDPLQLARHPSQLYQFALEGVALFIVLWWFSAKPRPRMAVSGLFLLCYGCFRILVEFFREPDAHLGFIAFDWLTMGQLLSLPMVLIGAGLMLWGYRNYPLQDGLNVDDRNWLERHAPRAAKAGTKTQKISKTKQRKKGKK